MPRTPLFQNCNGRILAEARTSVEGMHPFKVFQSGIGTASSDWRTVAVVGGYVNNLVHTLPAQSPGLASITVPASTTDFKIFTDTSITLYTTTSGVIDYSAAGWPFYPAEGSTDYADMRGNAANTDNKAKHRCKLIALVTTSNDTVKDLTIKQIAKSALSVSMPAFSGVNAQGCYTLF